jgi:hypothetical protein
MTFDDEARRAIGHWGWVFGPGTSSAALTEACPHLYGLRRENIELDR